jgi:hypothetical protein
LASRSNSAYPVLEMGSPRLLPSRRLRGLMRMRHLILPSLGVSLAVGLASAASPFDASAQEEAEGVSQGSLATHLYYVDVSERPSPGYSQIVDNATDGRFQASG